MREYELGGKSRKEVERILGRAKEGERGRKRTRLKRSLRKDADLLAYYTSSN